jgi:GNAT superfamily N-acetyltransferase
MPTPDGIELRDATEADLPRIAALREAVDWRAHDWALRLVLRPPGRCFVATDHGAVVGVGSGMAFGPIGVVGNMIVAADHRRRGIGASILDAVLEDLEARGSVAFELYATHDGRPLYARYGFVLEGASISVDLPASVSLDMDASVAVERGRSADLDLLATWDADRWGGDRRPVLGMAIADADRPFLVARRDGAVVGYAWLRAEDGRLGPFLADDAAAAEALLAAARPLNRAPALAFTLPDASLVAARWIAAKGLVSAPWDGHMVRGEPLPRRFETVWGSVVGALG